MVVVNPSTSEWKELARRPEIDQIELETLSADIFAAVERNGDDAVRRFTAKFDGVMVDSLVVTSSDIAEWASAVPAELRTAIDMAWNNVYEFHNQQLPLASAEITQTTAGVMCWQEARSIESVGLYVPGGSAPLISTAIMLGVPARIAGCSKIVMATPPGSDGSINSAICYVAQKINATVIRTGGMQAIAAMSIGTQSIPKVDKLFGPGNQYVTAAKCYAQNYGVAIDMPAGPSEVMVLADETAKAEFVAADLLSQAEHGSDSQVVLLATSSGVAMAVKREVQRQLPRLTRREVIKASLESSRFIVFDDKATAIAFANYYAPEHLVVQCQDSDSIAGKIVNAGSVFLGVYSPESAGDYASGTNHTLPTNGWAKSYSGVSVASFMKTISFQRLTKSGLKILAPAITTLAKAEGLTAHANAVDIRINGEIQQ